LVVVDLVGLVTLLVDLVLVLTLTDLRLANTLVLDMETLEEITVQPPSPRHQTNLHTLSELVVVDQAVRVATLLVHQQSPAEVVLVPHFHLLLD
jgi:hypothetical protein